MRYIFILEFDSDRILETAEIKDKLREVLNRTTMGVRPGSLAIVEEHVYRDRIPEQG